MASCRVGLILGRSGRAFVFGCSINARNTQDNQNLAYHQTIRYISQLEISKNIELLSAEKINTSVSNLKLTKTPEKPLVVVLSWLLARRKDVFKYAHFYISQGFDVLNVSCTPWQLLWPMKGSQLVANELITFLDKNITYQPLVVHGFSVGAYVWGELLVRLTQDQTRYKHIIDRIVAQVWDSAADITELTTGVPVAVFPRNPVMQSALQQYLVYHLKAFNKIATVHYIRSSQMFHTNFIKAPALFFVSKIDPIGTVTANTRVKESWESLGIKVTWKCFDKSPHVGHFRYNREEYISEMSKFLNSLDLLQHPEKIPYTNK